MIDRDNIFQPSDQIIDIATWPVHEDYEVFNEGARDKSLRVCPADSGLDFCLPNHKYLFKEAIKSAKDFRKPRHPDQYWAEVIAFRIGRFMGLQVPPAFVAINSETGEPGSLIEWFTGYTEGLEERSSPGGDHMQAMIEDYDRGKGRKHNLKSILAFSRTLSMMNLLKHDWREYWGLCLCFDALVGNTDRHQENWRVIWYPDGTAQLSPYFDNGTSLGHELFPPFTSYIKDKNRLAAYVRRGQHHMRWSLDEKKRLPLIEGVNRYCEKYPQVIPVLVDRLSWEEDSLQRVLQQLTEFAIQSPLTTERAEFVYELTCYRKRLLLSNLEKIGNEVH